MLLKILVSDGYMLCNYVTYDLFGSQLVAVSQGEMSLVAIELNTGAPPRLQTYYLNSTRIGHLQV